MSDQTMAPQANSTNKAWNIALWVLQVLLALAFLAAGASKLAGAPMMVATFEKIGLGQWFRYLTGGLEVIGAIALLVPTLSGVGALLLVCIMVGAVITHLFKIGGSPAAPLVLLVLSAVIAWGRRDRTASLLGVKSLSRKVE